MTISNARYWGFTSQRTRCGSDTSTASTMPTITAQTGSTALPDATSGRPACGGTGAPE